MTDRPERENLLPGDATAIERAIADTDGRLDDIDMELVRRVGGPSIAAVPAPYLPYRAWSRSVDVWDPLWPEDVRRAVIEAQPIVQVHKGTPFGVETALAALRVATSIVEWWETLPQGAPYTFRVRAYVRSKLYDGPRLDARMIGLIYATVMRTKGLSRAFDLSVGVAFAGKPGFVPIAVGKVRTERGLAALPVTGLRAGLGLAPVAVARTRASRAMVARLPPEDP